MQSAMKWLTPIPEGMIDWLYSSSAEDDAQRGCIGHLRGDFGRDGDEFWTSWFDHASGEKLKTDAFRAALDKLIHGLSRRRCLLCDFSTMRLTCRNGRAIGDESYGFMAELDGYLFCIRCIPRRGDYNFYVYCYERSAS